MVEEYCEEFECYSPVDRDGVCYRHRLLSVGMNLYSLKALNKAGESGAGLGKRSRDEFKAKTGREAVSASERWI
jgi:hypothetical protein